MTAAVKWTRADAAALAGPHPSDPVDRHAPKDYIAAGPREGDLSGKRRALQPDPGQNGVGQEVRTAFELALGRLRARSAPKLVELDETPPDWSRSGR